jgi:tRNA pseudouridine55 synthase
MAFRDPSGLNGVLVVDKPSGPTSHDVVDRVRAALGTRRAGHTGTLDPFATGVLPVCVGKATRLVRFLASGSKTYRAAVRLGFATTTDDLTGEPLAEPRPVPADVEQLRAACGTFVGELTQTPPAYSAKHVGGRRLYELARAGRLVEAPVARVRVLSLELLSVAGDVFEIEVSCSPGTYIRAIARDLGEALGCGGHLVSLRRTRSGEFDLSQATPWDALEPRAEIRVVPMAGLLVSVPAVTVGPEGVAAVRHGRDLRRALVLEGFPEERPQLIRILNSGGELLGLAVPRGFGFEGSTLPVEPTLHPEVVLID